MEGLTTLSPAGGESPVGGETMEISIRYNQKERDEFIQWITARYDAVILDGDYDYIDDDANITLNELWAAYCES